MPLESLDTQDVAIADAQWQARVDLAAAHRIAVVHGFHEGIFNHLTLRVPGRNDRYYQIPFGLHWSEVTASCLLEVGYDGTLLSGEGMIERSAYCIHAPIHRLVPAAAAVFHTHQPYASALARLEDPRILPIGQTEVGIMMVTAYDNTYAGPAFDTTVAEAYDFLYYSERVAQVQLYAMSSGRQLKFLPDDVVEATIASYKKGESYGGRPPCDWHFDALKRQLDKTQPDYKD
jgi:ribulose-5-phosphate 4-epimerase/fuculose-1-phosphate aldolase